MSQSQISRKRNEELRRSASLTKPKELLPRLQSLYESGHPDRAGIELGIEDNIIQDAADALGEKQ